ncbi:KamA family radical SAM protein [bacterium]|nr:KamA family radical SAM protein [bacterium]
MKETTQLIDIPAKSLDAWLKNKICDPRWNEWEWQISQRITRIGQMPPLSWLTKTKESELKNVCERFPMAITPYYLSLMNLDDPDDPLLKQALPSTQEMLSEATSFEDPLNEEANSPINGLTHRYPDRVLFVVTNSCAVYCRHCTRKRLWGKGREKILTKTEIQGGLDYIMRHPEVKDVLVSGGDPLLLPTSLIDYLLQGIRKIPHVEIIRICTRVPVVMPQRIDRHLLDVIEKYGPVWLNTQFNHPNEITEKSAASCDLVLRRGIPVSNQTVLLKGINDSPEIIKKLNRQLLKIKVRPYYLFQCDPVTGTEHLRTNISTGIQIMDCLRGYISGLGVPQFVVDLPGGGGKVPLQPQYIVSQTEDRIIFRNYEGKLFVHNEPFVRKP